MSNIVISTSDEKHYDFETGKPIVSVEAVKNKTAQWKLALEPIESTATVNTDYESNMKVVVSSSTSSEQKVYVCNNKKKKELFRQNVAQPEEQSETRLEHLINNIEDAIHGDDLLVPEDLLEFATYLSSDDRQLRRKAIESFADRFKPGAISLLHSDGGNHAGKGHICSKLGEMRRPINGDLIIDVICDVISADEGQRKMQDLIQLLAVTGHVYEEKGQATMPSSRQLKIASAVINAATQTVSLKGPDIYIASSNESSGNIHIHVHICIYIMLLPDIVFAKLPKGWSFSLWMKLSDCEESVYDVFYFQNDTTTKGLRIALDATQIASMGAVSFGFVIQSLPLDEDSTAKTPSGKSQHRITQNFNLVIDKWHFVVFTQSQARLFYTMTLIPFFQKKKKKKKKKKNTQSIYDLLQKIKKRTNNFQIYLDGVPGAAVTIPFLGFSDSDIQIGIGGFHGFIGQSFFWETPMNDPTVQVLYACGPTYTPPIYARGQLRIAGFPKNPTQKAAPMQPGKSGYLLLPFCYSLDCRGCSEVLCLPRGWGDEVAERTIGLDIIAHPNNKSALVSMGGIFVGILHFITESVSENLSLLRQIFTMGLGSIKLYILDHLYPEKRTLLVLNAIKELLAVLETNDREKQKTTFTRGFEQVIMDVSYWIQAPKDVIVGVVSYIHTLVETRPDLMIHCLSISDILIMVKQYYPMLFPPKDHETSKFYHLFLTPFYLFIKKKLK
ncbi:hypothetical protein RFI_17211 [Reticulomyxa filosa]|uniref:DUF4704 domain-containing protein n=1 Tax=Reticulomyxa filosa TaxID=46433 RepID=X6N2Q0_RETFI|nr:hypothetical protein RFI_17211 [Reticulomyxa filosa]|eukprot:ETO20009.1 hypothetical protein RFI_17211 [Reticulomyxa filosa]